MTAKRIGKLTPRYSFILNPYSDERLSKCPKCQKATHARKFALFIYIDQWGPMLMGKTCVYCTPCQLIIVHQAELEAELADKFATMAPDVIGNQYMVLGTVAKKVWQRGLQGSGTELGEVLRHTADFKKVLDLKVEPGGWYPAEEK